MNSETFYEVRAAMLRLQAQAQKEDRHGLALLLSRMMDELETQRFMHAQRVEVSDD